MQSVTRADISLDHHDGAASAPGSGRIPLRDFFRNAQQSNFRISPDGKRLSFLQPHHNRMNVFVRPCAGGTPVRVTDETERDVSTYLWKGSNRIVYIKDVNGDENWHIVAVDADGRNLVDLTPFDGVRAQIIDDCEHLDDEMIIGLNRRKREVFDVYRLDLETRQLMLLAENPGNITTWLPDHDGRIRVAVSKADAQTSMLYRADDKGPFQTVITTDFREGLSPLFFDFDNRLIYATSNIGRDKNAIVRIDPATAREESVARTEGAIIRRVHHVEARTQVPRSRSRGDPSRPGKSASGLRGRRAVLRQGRANVCGRNVERPQPGHALPLRCDDPKAREACRHRALARRKPTR